jgi:hypothetical protein
MFGGRTLIADEEIQHSGPEITLHDSTKKLIHVTGIAIPKPKVSLCHVTRNCGSTLHLRKKSNSNGILTGDNTSGNPARSCTIVQFCTIA